MSFDTPIPPYNASDPHATYLNVSCLDLLLIEMVPMAERMARRAERAESGAWAIEGGEKEEEEGAEGGRVGRRKKKKEGGQERVREEKEVEQESSGGQDGGEVYRDAVFFRLDGLGYRVGQGLSESATRGLEENVCHCGDFIIPSAGFSRDRPRFVDNLDVIKFLCKDLWTILFKKQIDNLKTNHRGVYVLTDNSFRPFMRMSMSNATEALTKAQPYLFFPCGIIRGALSSLGIHATVQAESSDLPQAVFQIKTVVAKP